MNKQRSGFTLLETALVVAIATLLFMAIVVGFGGRIATSRYDTAATGVVDYLRDVFTGALNTENNRTGIDGAREYCTLSSAPLYASGEDREKLFFSDSGQDYNNAISSNPTAFYPGRTNCAIYGKIIFFGVAEGSSNNITQKNIHVFDIVGNVATGAKQIKSYSSNEYDTDLEYLQKLRLQGGSILDELAFVGADFRAALPEQPENSNSECLVSPAAGYETHNFDWGTFPKSANYDGDFIGFVMIVRSPLSGDVSMLFYERPSSAEPWKLGIGDNCNTLTESLVKSVSPVEMLKTAMEDEYTTGEDFHNGFCLNSEDAYVALFSRRKFIEFIENGQNPSAIKLNETDIKKSDLADPESSNGGYNPCI